MKRLLCSVLVLLILLTSVPSISFAMTEEEYKQHIRAMFADAPDEDLKNLFEAVQYELMCRGYKFNFDGSHSAAVQTESSGQKEVTVPAGKYVIGEDIPASTYSLVPNGYMALVTIWNSSGGMVTMHSLSEGSPVGKIELKNGQSIEITGSSVIFKPYTGLDF